MFNPKREAYDDCKITSLKKLVTNCDRLASLKHSSVNPLLYNEQGVAMLSFVLKSKEVIQINNEIIRAFAWYKVLLKENEELKKRKMMTYFFVNVQTPSQLSPGVLAFQCSHRGR